MSQGKLCKHLTALLDGEKLDKTENMSFFPVHDNYDEFSKKIKKLEKDIKKDWKESVKGEGEVIGNFYLSPFLKKISEVVKGYVNDFIEMFDEHIYEKDSFFYMDYQVLAKLNLQSIWKVSLKN